MKRAIILNVILTIVLMILGASCAQNNYNNTMMNSNSMNGNMMNSNMMNRNSMMNSNQLSGNMMNNSDTSKMMEMKSSPDAAKQPFDLQFIDTMTAHHEGAVEMAKLVDSRTQNPDLKKFALQIISTQTKEIGQMKDWREKWFANKPAAQNMEMPGMMDSMKMDMNKLSNSKDKDFDLAFIAMMIPHHKGATTMSIEALNKSEKPEIKTLANQIIKAQEAEIKMMQDWQTKWSK